LIKKVLFFSLKKARSKPKIFNKKQKNALEIDTIVKKKNEAE
jgi:hypothetical protein